MNRKHYYQNDFQLIYNILIKCSQNKFIISKIVTANRIQFSRAKMIIDGLLSINLLERFDHLKGDSIRKNKTSYLYAITKKGLEFLDRIKEIKELPMGNEWSNKK